MSPEERQLLTQLFDRLGQASNAPRDREAEELIADEMRRQPHAPYVMAQAVIIQEKGLEAATARIRELEGRIADLESRASQAPAPQQGGGSFLGGLSSMFGGGNQAPAPQRAPAPSTGPWGNAPQAQRYDDAPRYAPQPQAGPWGQQAAAAPAGGGFLRGAMTTAAGVAGGMLMADAVRDLFSSHNPGFGNMLGMGGMGGGEPRVEETVINNYYGDGNNQGADDNRDTGNQDNGFQQADYDNSDNSYDDSSYDDGGGFDDGDMNV
ncbi:DUF2076 domain-containing protein [Allorhizobium sp. BGMRC 0089]|uniref:DUF2076 domain-containing protein n=1 Tax=Allorhizobium sonneratiae TaxID=2934936 RepID=UPI002033AEEE|nr:DUF2076 domain-containing protein [Allorhizobium sonneratiae]MCM2291172.1 DUF2076 domain-containing protein [Allorhizobium sonneratiae]